MNFYKLLLPTSMEYALAEEGYYVWCGTMLKYKDTYYTLYSRWKKQYGFDGWVSHSEICLAKSDTMFGKYTFVKVILGDDGNHSGDRSVYHNPTVIS